jgi:hypothetical protein
MAGFQHKAAALAATLLIDVLYKTEDFAEHDRQRGKARVSASGLA